MYPAHIVLNFTRNLYEKKKTESNHMTENKSDLKKNQKKDLIRDNLSEQIVAVAGDLAKEHGAKNVTVRSILQKIGISNRVFYNRFHNINEVLELVHDAAVLKMRESLRSEIDITKDFFGYIEDIAVKTLINTYDVKKQFSQYMFEYDSKTEANHRWWTKKVEEIIEIGKATNQLKEVDSEALSYAVWCFFRGYNADAVNRRLPKSIAIKDFLTGLQFLFYGIAK